jgi:hypothetical protein
MTDTTHTHAAHPMMKFAAPLVALGATWASEQALSVVYRKVTGHEPPATDDRSVSFSRALAWTVATATTAAVVSMVIYRYSSRVVPDAPR